MKTKFGRSSIYRDKTKERERRIERVGKNLFMTIIYQQLKHRCSHPAQSQANATCNLVSRCEYFNIPPFSFFSFSNNVYVYIDFGLRRKIYVATSNGN